MKKYSRLILVLALLLVGCVTHLKDEPFNWAGHSCVFTGELDAPGFFETATYPYEYNGTFRCTNPDGSHLTCPNTNQPAENAEFRARVTKPRDITEKNFWASIGCGAAARPTPTVVPTATGTTTPVPAAAHPALTLQKGASPNTVYSFKDNVIQYTFVVTNSGDVPIEGGSIEVHDSMNPNAITCPSETLDIGESVSCSASFTLTFASRTEQATIQNCATAVGSYADQSVTSNESCVDVAYVPPANNAPEGAELPICLGDPQPGICISP